MSIRTTQLSEPGSGGAVSAESPLAFIEQLVGPEKGRIVELAGTRLSIGRADDCDIVIQSEAVSRIHAYLMQSDGAWYIRDNNSKNGIQVNGNAVTEAWLQTGDVVQVGNFVFRFRDPAGEASVSEQDPMAMAGLGTNALDPAAADGQREASRWPSAAPKKKPNRRLLIYGILGLVLAYALYSSNQSSDSGPKPADASADQDAVAQKLQEQLQTAETRKKLLLAMQDYKQKIAEIDQKLQEQTKDGNQPDPAEFDKLVEERRRLGEQLKKAARDLNNTPADPNAQIDPQKVADKDLPNQIVGIEDPTLKDAEQQMAKLDWTNSALKQAEQFFRRGQRDYLTGEYQRAIDEFQTALSFYRGHKLAEKYLRLSVFEVESQAKKNMEMGLQYFESLQYQRAMYHFREVVDLMQHKPQEPMVLEAQKYVILCKRRLEAAELFP